MLGCLKAQKFSSFPASQPYSFLASQPSGFLASQPSGFFASQLYSFPAFYYIFKKVIYGRTMSIVGSTPLKTSAANPAKRQTPTSIATAVNAPFSLFNRISFF
jgi:hypothetical protein